MNSELVKKQIKKPKICVFVFGVLNSTDVVQKISFYYYSNRTRF